MTDMYNEESSSKKKFLIPLIVLLLCGVALTGAAYAYNATLTDKGDATTEYSELSLGCTGGKIYFTGVVNNLTGDKTYTSDASESVLKFTVTDAKNHTTELTSVTADGIYTDADCKTLETGLTANAGAHSGMNFLVTVSGELKDTPAATYYLKLTVNGANVTVTVPSLA